MKGLKFYQEFHDRYRRHPSGNVIAARSRSRNVDGLIPCVAASRKQPNSPVRLDAVDPTYLKRHCRQITEAQARKLHPKMFEQLKGE
jgi:hypothetical protein